MRQQKELESRELLLKELEAAECRLNWDTVDTNAEAYVPQYREVHDPKEAAATREAEIAYEDSLLRHEAAERLQLTGRRHRGGRSAAEVLRSKPGGNLW